MSDWLDAEHHVERAHELYELGRWDEAETELRSAIRVNPYQAEWHFNLGLTLEAAGRSRDAAASFADAHRLREGDGYAALMAAANLVRAGEAKQAMEWLDEAEQSGHRPVELYVHRLEALTDLGRHEEAETAFYLGQEVSATNPDLYAAMAESLLERGEHERAVWCLREAARLDPGMPGIQARLGRAYASSGRQERARQLYMRELRRDPGDIDTLLDLVDLLIEMNRLPEASEKARRVLELEPDNVDAHAALVDIHESHGDRSEAITEADVVVRLDPEYPGARRRLAGLLLQRGAAGDSRRCNELLAGETNRLRKLGAEASSDDLADLGQLLLDAGRSREAIRVFRVLVGRDAKDAAARHHLSVALLRAGDAEDGIEQARAAVRLDGKCIPAMHNLALAHVKRGEWMRARYWVNQALLVDPDDAPVRRLRHTLAFRTAWQLSLRGVEIARRAVRPVVGLVVRPRRS